MTAVLINGKSFDVAMLARKANTTESAINGLLEHLQTYGDVKVVWAGKELFPLLADPSSCKELDEAVDAWNKLAKAFPPVPRIQKLTTARQKALKKRLSEFGGIEGWHTMIDLILRSPHLLGKNDRGWTVYFDWVLEPKNLTKIMEGNYVRDEPRQRKGAISSAFESVSDALDRGGY